MTTTTRSRVRAAAVDLIGLAGIGCIGTGLWWVRPWASLVSVGTILLALAVLATLRRGRG